MTLVVAAWILAAGSSFHLLPKSSDLHLRAVLLLIMSGTAVAKAIGAVIIDASAVRWSSLAARWGIPTSERHALVAGLAGRWIASAGP